MIVADTNTIAYAVTTSPYTEAAYALLEEDSDWIAPIVWRSEMANLLAIHVRRSILSLTEALQAQSVARELINGQEFEVLSEDVLELACASGASAYDCEFVVLAQNMGCKLITMDRKLVKAFPDTARLLTNQDHTPPS